MCEVKVQNHRSLGCTKAIFYEFYRIIKISKIREFLFTNFKTIGHEFSTCAHWPLWLKAYSHGKRPKQAGVSFTRRYDVVSRTARLKCLLSFCGRSRLPHTGQWWRLPQEKNSSYGAALWGIGLAVRYRARFCAENYMCSWEISTKTAATRAALFDSEHQIVCRLGLRPTPTGGAYSAPPDP